MQENTVSLSPQFLSYLMDNQGRSQLADDQEAIQGAPAGDHSVTGAEVVNNLVTSSAHNDDLPPMDPLSDA